MGSKGLAGIVLTSVLLAGCATGRSSQADIDALNARITALQGQMAAKDQENSVLKNQVDDERMAREAAEAALRSSESVKKSISEAGAKRTLSDLK